MSTIKPTILSLFITSMIAFAVSLCLSSFTAPTVSAKEAFQTNTQTETTIFVPFVVEPNSAPPTGTAIDTIDTIEEFQQLWASQNITNYQFLLETQLCNCIPGENNPALVTVRNGEVVSVIDPTSGELRQEFLLNMTIDELFEIAIDAEEREADLVSIQYGTYVLPTNIYIDYVDTLEGDQLRYTVTEFSILPSDPTWQSGLEQQQEIWASQNITNYQYQLQIGCFCFGPTNAVIVVEDGNVQSVTDSDTGEPIDDVWFQLTLDDLFMELFDAQQNKSSSYDVEYDSAYGFPESIFIDHYGLTLNIDGSGDDIQVFMVETADDEIGYTISKFMPNP